jgi:transcriptional regulator with XRE-family HTH domain
MATTEHADTELVADTSRRGRGRRYRSILDRASILERFDRSGLTQRAFAKAEGVKYATLISWLTKRRAASPAPEVSPALRFEEVQIGAPMPFEVRLPCGTLLRGSQVDGLAQLVRLLRS